MPEGNNGLPPVPERNGRGRGDQVANVHNGSVPGNAHLSEMGLTHKELKLNEQSLQRGLPAYDHTLMRWSQHWTICNTLLHSNPVTDQTMKRMIFCKMAAATFAIISEDYNPDMGACMAITLAAYAQALGSIFEPQSEKDAARDEYKERQQKPGEHASAYCHDKLRLFKAAYAENERAWSDFYVQLTLGLLNVKATNHMLKFVPSDITTDFKRYLTELANYSATMRKKLSHGMCSTNDVVGLDTHQHLRDQNTHATLSTVKVKREGMINGLNALSLKNKGKKDIKCWSCGAQGHIQAQCPRGTSGLATNAVQSQAEGFEFSEDEEEGEDTSTESVQFVKRPQKHVRFVSKSKSGKYRPGSKRRVVCVVEEMADGSKQLVEEREISEVIEDSDQDEGPSDSKSQAGLHFLG